jgi:hypothetical protein
MKRGGRRRLMWTWRRGGARGGALARGRIGRRRRQLRLRGRLRGFAGPSSWFKTWCLGVEDVGMPIWRRCGLQDAPLFSR